MKHQTLLGPTLLAVLRLTAEDVKLFEKGATSPVKISPQQALSLARSGLYEGVGTRKRVKHIREIDARTPNVHDASFWDGRGCIRFFPDQRSEPAVVC